MKILGIDTSTKFLCIGIYDNSKVYEYNLEVSVRLSSLLSVTIKRVLDAADLRINDIDYFACGLGPGSFTGIRVGLATIKGLAWALNKSIIGISTLDILARNVNFTLSNYRLALDTRKGKVKPSDTFIVPIIDAKRNLIYSSVYKTKDGTLKRLMPYMLLTCDDFFKRIKPHSIIFGDAISLYKEKILRNIKGVTILDKDYWYPKAHNIVDSALERIRDKKFNNLLDIKPIYLYPKECQIRIRK